MARKTESGSTSGNSRAAASLSSLRSQVDKVDLQILKLINDRARLASDIGKVKHDQAGDIFAPAREEEVLQNLIANNQGPLDAATIRAIYREIMSGSRALQRTMKIAYLGGGDILFSHLAVLERFGQAFESLRVNSISAVFEEVNSRHADIGVVPLENSTDGRVADTLEMFIRLPITSRSAPRFACASSPPSACELRSAGDSVESTAKAAPRVNAATGWRRTFRTHRNTRFRALLMRLAWLSLNRAMQPSPAGKQPSVTACECCSKTSKIRRTMRHGLRSSARKKCRRVETTRLR